MHTINTFVPKFTTIFWGTHIVVTPKLISSVLCIPKVEHLDYPSHTRLHSISWGEMTSLFCEIAMVWGETLNFSITEFAKAPRILNMVMTFLLTTRSHSNTITKPYAHFLLSLMDNLSIDFSSHIIESMIDIYWDTAIRNKLIFPSAITRILTHLHITIPCSPPFYSMGAISKESIQRSDAQLVAKRPCVESTTTDLTPASWPSSSSTPPSSSRVKVSLVAIMDQLQHMRANFGSCLNHLFGDVSNEH